MTTRPPLLNLIERRRERLGLSGTAACGLYLALAVPRIVGDRRVTPRLADNIASDFEFLRIRGRA